MNFGVISFGLSSFVFADGNYGYGMMGGGTCLSGGIGFFELVVVILLVAILYVLINDKKNNKSKKQ